MDIEIKQSGLRKDPPTWKGKITESALFQNGGVGVGVGKTNRGQIQIFIL